MHIINLTHIIIIRSPPALAVIPATNIEDKCIYLSDPLSISIVFVSEFPNSKETE